MGHFPQGLSLSVHTYIFLRGNVFLSCPVEKKEIRQIPLAVFGGSPQCRPHSHPLDWGLPSLRCQGTRWRPIVKGAERGGPGWAFTYSEVRAPLKPRRCQLPGFRSYNRSLALGSSLLVEISSTYFSDDVTHSDFLHFES